MEFYIQSLGEQEQGPFSNDQAITAIIDATGCDPAYAQLVVGRINTRDNLRESVVHPPDGDSSHTQARVFTDEYLAAPPQPDDDEFHVALAKASRSYGDTGGIWTEEERQAFEAREKWSIAGQRELP